MRLLTCLLAVFLMVGLANAHPGRLNAQGCHNDRSTGTMHCHRGTTPTPSPNQQQQNTQRNNQGGVYYRNCTEARAAGVTPIRRGEPGYGRHLDRDGDGVACE